MMAEAAREQLPGVNFNAADWEAVVLGWGG